MVAVTGARQVGKSSLLEAEFGSESDTVVFDATSDVDGARRDPDLFLDARGFTVRGPKPSKPRLILDEIQFAPELVSAIKRRVDADRTPGRFLVTGSQQWQVMRSLAESLAGRVMFLDLEAFTAAELRGHGDRPPWLEAWLADPAGLISSLPRAAVGGSPLAERLWRGFMPGLIGLPNEAVTDFHTSYLRAYIERDARTVGGAADWQEFGRFVRLAAALTGQEINRSQLGRDVGVTPQTAGRWLDVLSATFQWYELPSFERNPVKRVSARPKGYLHDVGLAAALLSISGPAQILSHPRFGALLETAVVGDLRRQASILSTRPQLSHFRTHGGAEVDLVLERDGMLFPIEVKATARPARSDTTGLAAFRARHRDARIAPGLVLAPVAEAYALSEHDWAFPWDPSWE